MHECTATVVSSEARCSGLLYELVLSAPPLAAQVKPGQFVHLALLQAEHILRRPLSVYQANKDAGTLTLLFQVMGEGTRHLTELTSAQQLQVLGPIGQGWNPPETAKRALLIGGGVGAAPLYLLAGELNDRGVLTEVILGAATADLLACEASFVTLLTAGQVHITTDDGSRGYKGFTTEVAAQLLAENRYDYVATCGPEPMQRIVAAMTAESGALCEVSLERRMACGIGACLSCVVDTVNGKKRACVDGPVFDAREVCW
ncbi:MAG: dihydroorotate dehydrogenase electron transfer subunit [Coriobacteriales bacterium]|jgi:dihydroorotate dehydrogenase electron transfer subunit|nr:dihydroorotate dehydrogenase electron transfer subunit [Coriobacteriales bacterium]